MPPTWRGIKVVCENPVCEVRGEIREVDLFTDTFELPMCGYCGEQLVLGEE